jgi:N-acetylmuramate 1-kinase
MSSAVVLDLDEAGVGQLAEILVCLVRSGDCIALQGDLGAGKSTFARAFIRAALGDQTADVPSPTFSIQQFYVTDRFTILHTDLYRLISPDDVEETGLVEAMERAVTLVEWPDRAATLLPSDRFDLELSNGTTPERRRVHLTGAGACGPRAQRAMRIFEFLHEALGDTEPVRIRYMQGDASTRAYARVTTPSAAFVMMDWPRQPDGPQLSDGRTYSQIAHLAEDVRPFIAIGNGLRDAGLSAPTLIAADIEHGLLLLEDLGTRVFGDEIKRGTDQPTLVSAAVDVLLHLRRIGLASPLPVAGKETYVLPRRDRAAFDIETELLLDWYWPSIKGAPASAAVRAEFRALWSPVIDRLLTLPSGIFLRDFHSPNLIWLPERSPSERRVGLIDYQDALAEHWSFDLVSVLQDARVDVSAKLERAEFERYCRRARQHDPAFDSVAFARAYADFGAQRNTRLIGLWARLLIRDSKPNYLQHLPRTWDYLERNLAAPALLDLRAWFAHHFPSDVRKSMPGA